MNYFSVCEIVCLYILYVGLALILHRTRGLFVFYIAYVFMYHNMYIMFTFAYIRCAYMSYVCLCICLCAYGMGRQSKSLHLSSKFMSLLLSVHLSLLYICLCCWLLAQTACAYVCMHRHMDVAIVDVPDCTTSFLMYCCSLVPSQEKCLKYVFAIF